MAKKKNQPKLNLPPLFDPGLDSGSLETPIIIPADLAPLFDESPPLPLPPVFDAPPPSGPLPEHLLTLEVEELRAVAAELSRRRTEALLLYEPLPSQAPFHESPCKRRILRGSNRGGKTLPAAVEVARAVTGQDPFGKYPKKDGRCYCVAKNLKRVGDVMWYKLGRAGPFKMIRDEETGIWRAFRPHDAQDQARADEVKAAPPLIPPRLIELISWENKKEGIPSRVKLKTGWELVFFSSEGKPPQGVDVDLVWFDEEIVDEAWFPEMMARLLDRKGRFIWSATPQAGTEHLYRLHERAEDRDEVDGIIAVEEFVILLADNPHIGEREKRELAADLNEDQYLVRIGGEYAVEGTKVYPEFNKNIHCVDPFEGGIPHDWCRFMVTDPGTQVCAVLFAAVPPPRLGDFVYLYDELYIKRCSADLYGEKVAQRIGDEAFEAFIIDSHAGRYTELGSGKTVEQQYAEALKKHGVASRRTGSGFIHGSDDPAGGRESFRRWLRIRQDGTPKLKVVGECLPNFIREIKRYHFKREPDGTPSDKPLEKNNHLMDDCRYLAAYDPVYHKPVPGKRRNYVLEAMARKKKTKKPRTYVRLGAGTP